MKPRIIIDLPYPPTVNSVWRSNRGRVHRSKKYTDWIKNSWGHWLQQKPSQEIKSIKGYYALYLILNTPDKRRRDIGNAEKACSDFLQLIEVVQDDCFCKDLHIVDQDTEYAPNGARLIVSPWLTKE